jgi:CDP-diacylglycerol--glycerol-3-phosphate 3-phosphatidyltransferase
MLTFMAASGSFLVSYTRARAESLGYDCKAGIMTRVERFLIMVMSLISNQVVIGLWIIAIGANLTAIQRILIVKKQMENQISERGKQNA